jgi:hypothetical protein
MKYKLYSDSNRWHIEYPASMSDRQITRIENIPDRIRKVALLNDGGFEYRADHSGFLFSIRYIYS